MTSSIGEYNLSLEEIKQFHEQGFLGPFTLMSPDEAREIRERIDEEVLPVEGTHRPHGEPDNPYHDPHASHRFVYDLFTDPAILDRMASIYGPDLLIFESHLWEKMPGGLGTAWHQDGQNWPIEPGLMISAWIALTEATEENSCLQVIPRSHEGVWPTTEVEDSELPIQTDFSRTPEHISKANAVSMELDPGQFFLFNERTVHHADRNRSDGRRLATSLRVTIPIVNVDHDSEVFSRYPDHEVYHVRGEDYQGLNRLGTPPSE